MFADTNEAIEQCIYKEKLVAQQYGDGFSSKHEFFGVLHEEVYEALEEIQKLVKGYKKLDYAIRKEKEYPAVIEEIRSNAVLAIKELLQICAVCDKEKEATSRDKAFG